MRKQLLRIAILVILPVSVFAQSQELREGDTVTTHNYYNELDTPPRQIGGRHLPVFRNRLAFE